MSVEGLWIIRFGDANMPEIIPGYSNAGIVVLETGRIFGGDAGYFYLGDFTVDREMITGRARVTHFNGPPITAFGMQSTSFEIGFQGEVMGPRIEGVIWLLDDRNRALPIILEFKAALP